MLPAVIPHSKFTDEDIRLYFAGKHHSLYHKLGNHRVTLQNEDGVYFAVWAPNAHRVTVSGSFNNWDTNSHTLYPRLDNSGIWEGVILHIPQGTLYKYAITDAQGSIFEKGDPYARRWEHPPNKASIVWESNYAWQDQSWLQQRAEGVKLEKPLSVYEVHLGSWKKADGEKVNYRSIAPKLISYLLDMGFTHVEFMPLMEFPYEPSWGYQITGYFAPSSRYGLPEDFMFLIDALHQAGIGVILDWVPSHFPTDGHGLSYFDGTHLYEHPNPQKGYHPDWSSYIFNYENHEVRAFLLSNAMHWLRDYHIDGLRVDAVASLLYLDYSRNDGEWAPNKFGGRENLEAVSFIKELNHLIHSEYPEVLTIAEESTAYPGVSHSIKTGGLGFDMKWMMGWMHDALKYFQMDPLFRKDNQNLITFSFSYAFNEKFMLPLSHDEVVHGKASMIYKMPGEEPLKFANLRALYSLMYFHPGAKLLFMGGEFGQTTEWNFMDELRWDLLEYSIHKGLQNLIRQLNYLYTTEPALYQQQFSYEGFEWIAGDDTSSSVVSFLRKGKAKNDTIAVICHFTPVHRENYKVGFPIGGNWQICFNSDEVSFAGKGLPVINALRPKSEEWNGKPYSALIDLPPLSVLAYKYVVNPEEEE